MAAPLHAVHYRRCSVLYSGSGAFKANVDTQRNMQRVEWRPDSNLAQMHDFDMRDISKMRNFVRAPLSDAAMSVCSQVGGHSIHLLEDY